MPAKIKITTVIKSTGKKEQFNITKILRSITLAGKDTSAYGDKAAKEIITKVMEKFARLETNEIATSEIRKIVEPTIAEAGYFETAKYYILYKERKEQRKGKKLFLKEPVLSDNARLALITRCSRQDAKGKYVETPADIFRRVARHVAKAEINWGNEKDVEEEAANFLERMTSLKFVCTTSALYEAGNDACPGQLSPCFVLKIEDSIPSIFKTLGEAALIQKNFGGTGFNFSAIRFKGDKVRNVPGAASGPVDFLQAYSAALSKIIQGAKKHGGNMGILNVNHPDIEDFIKVKDVDGNMKNFNLSVGVTTDFMERVIANKKFNLVNPRDGKTTHKIKARELFAKICAHAWKSGDPGMIFLDRMEEDNFTPTLGKLEATNPCGEQPLLPYESCNLSSIHLANHVLKTDKGYEINWEDLGKTVKTGVRFLDNMIEVNYYVLPETEKMGKLGNRKIGLGVIGFAHVLFKLGIPYNSAEAVRLADKIGKFIKSKAEEASMELARVRGVFPNWDISTYKGSAERYRNCTMMTIAPTGTVSMIGDTTSGIEPSFALVYKRKSFYDQDKNNNSTQTLYYVDPVFALILKEKGLYSDKLIEKIEANGGSISGIEEIPVEMRKIFVTTHQIEPIWHIKIQAAFQKYCDNAVSKTVNFGNSATVEEVEKAYQLAWKLGCKGITIYRDGSKDDQVLNSRGEEKCPECKGKLKYEGGCTTCRDCGWSKCKL